MTNKPLKHSKSLESCLFKYCRSGKTGTVFISTVDGKSSQIVLRKGEITAFAFGKKRGFDAVLEFDKVKIKRSSFINNMQFPLTIYANINSSESVLNHLGYVNGLESEIFNKYDNEFPNNLIHSEPPQAFCVRHEQALEG